MKTLLNHMPFLHNTMNYTLKGNQIELNI